MAAEGAEPRLPPPWVGHLLVFGLLFALVLGWFVIQTRQAERTFQTDAREHARLLADAVALHARGALLAEEMTAAMLTRFLGNVARFVDYLDGIAPFNDEELAAFADEAGLSVIRIQDADRVTQGPAAWQPGTRLDCRQLERLIRLPAVHSVIFGIPSSRGEGCVLVGMDSRPTEALETAVGLPRALAAVAALPGVIKARLIGSVDPAATPADPGPTRLEILRRADGHLIARTRAPLAGAELYLELDAHPLQQIRARLWWELLAFLVVLVVSGSAGVWILLRHQHAHARQRLGYERRLSRQREEAGLGRAAAAIAHEIRNPLNAMAMGLQRLQLEADELTAEHRRLLELVQQAVQRTNGTISGLLDYARPLQPRRKRIALDRLAADHLELYAAVLATARVRLTRELRPDTWIDADPDLLRQVLDNLLRNAIEATGMDGQIALQVDQADGEARLVLENSGLEVAEAEIARLLEPWFTTKAQGTGLGLSISQRILTAHGGRLELLVPRAGWLRLVLALPVAGRQTGRF